MEAQREAVRGYLSSIGGILRAEYVEVETASGRVRPVLQAALDACRGEKAILVIAKLDRLARNVAFVSALMETRTEFVAVDAPFANRLMVHILAAFAEHEREQIAARTKAALAAAKARGVKLGVNGARLAVISKAEAEAFAETVRSELEALVRPSMTLAEIAAGLNERRVFTREGAAWCSTTVRRVMMRLGLSPYAAARQSEAITVLTAGTGQRAPPPQNLASMVQNGLGGIHAGSARPR